MKKNICGCFLVLTLSVASAYSACIATDGFESYTIGTLIPQGGWANRAIGESFEIQNTTALVGSQAVYNNIPLDKVIIKQGVNLTNGIQAFHIMTENRSNWAENSFIDVGVMSGLWDSYVTCHIVLQWNGDVQYLASDGSYQTFATFNDNEWVGVAMEWRPDATARYRINNEAWTDWQYINRNGRNGPTVEGLEFTSFDHVGMQFNLFGGSTAGGAYFDALGSDILIPEPSTSVLLLSGLLLFIRRRK